MLRRKVTACTFQRKSYDISDVRGRVGGAAPDQLLGVLGASVRRGRQILRMRMMGQWKSGHGRIITVLSGRCVPMHGAHLAVAVAVRR